MKKNVTGLRQSIVKAQASGALIRLTRSVEDGHIDGYVSLVGPDFLLVCIVSGEVHFDGFQALRFSDLTKVANPAPHHAFLRRALALRKLRRPPAPSIDLTSIEKLLMTGTAAFPLLTIHRELADPDVCHIGKVVKVSRKTVTLREITPDATWERKLYRYALSEITRVDLGGPYEDALHTVDLATQLGLAADEARHR